MNSKRQAFDATRKVLVHCETGDICTADLQLPPWVGMSATLDWSEFQDDTVPTSSHVWQELCVDAAQQGALSGEGAAVYVDVRKLKVRVE
jgi:hypothetical protein